jgi:hypothetical protein
VALCVADIRCLVLADWKRAVSRVLEMRGTHRSWLPGREPTLTLCELKSSGAQLPQSLTSHPRRDAESRRWTSDRRCQTKRMRGPQRRRRRLPRREARCRLRPRLETAAACDDLRLLCVSLLSHALACAFARPPCGYGGGTPPPQGGAASPERLERSRLNEPQRLGPLWRGGGV